jgi:hypothetical protein
MSKATQFKRIPDGTKTERMLQVEVRIGRKLEEDYKANYLDGSWGQKKLANHWGVQRQLIFGKLSGGRRNWVQKLGLPSKGQRPQTAHAQALKKCEICGVTGIALEGAHWIPASNGGSTKADNILKLCPNCHTQIDVMENATTVQRAREVILLRAAKVFLARTSPRGEQEHHEFFLLCRRIMSARERTPIC